MRWKAAKAATTRFLFSRFLPQISLRNLRKLDCYANRNPLRLKTLCRYDAAAPTAFGRAGGVQRKAAPNRFQTLIEATADVR